MKQTIVLPLTLLLALLAARLFAAGDAIKMPVVMEPSRTWYGPVDQVLEKTGEWRTYRFTHIPPFAGRWKLYVQLNGWGNFGNAVNVSFDDFTCSPSKWP